MKDFMNVNKFTHLDKDGKAKMVDISEKKQSLRYAKAWGHIILNKEIITAIKNNQIKKTAVF